MSNAWNKCKQFFHTLRLTVLLTLNMFFIVFLLLALVTVLVYFRVDGGFFIRDGSLTVKGGLVLIYAVAILAAASIVVMIRKVFIAPIQKIMTAMEKLSDGDFDIRVDFDREKYVPNEIREFGERFNRTASELQGTAILRKDFINNFSHEFKTPIVSISGFSDLLLTEDLPEEDRREYLVIIRDESRRLADLATSILTLSRVESQAILTQKEDFRLDEQLRQTVLITQQKWQSKKLDFQTDLPEVSYRGDAGLLREVWLNILDNAAKFSEEGKTVSITLRQADGGTEVSVTDQGPGMDETTVRHVFDQFYQGDTSHRAEGNGLGLAMVKRIVDLHDGSVSIDTAPGRGCCFTVTLPA